MSQYLPKTMAIIKKATTKKKKNNFFIFSGIFICLKTQYFIQATKTNDTALPIGVFDSGTGGLTVLEAILKLDAFNNETGKPGADGKPDFEKEQFIKVYGVEVKDKFQSYINFLIK